MLRPCAVHTEVPSSVLLKIFIQNWSTLKFGIRARPHIAEMAE